MNLTGYSRVATATPKLLLGDIIHNTNEIITTYNKANHDNVDLLVLPELSVTGYTMADMFHQRLLLDDSLAAISKIKSHTKNKHSIVIVGFPFLVEDAVYNCAAVIQNDTILGIIPKSYLPTYNEYYETRWFASANMLMTDTVSLFDTQVPIGADLIFTGIESPYLKFGVEICEDLWAPIPPSTHQALQGALVIANLSASNELIGKSEYRLDLIKNQSARMLSSYIYASSGFGESSTDVTYGGHCIIANNGNIVKENNRFSLDATYQYTDIDLEKLEYDRYHSNTHRECKLQELTFICRKVEFTQLLIQRKLETYIDSHPFVPSDIKKRELRCEEIFNIQTTALAKRLTHIGTPKAIIGISGGLDSTLALLVSVKTFDLLKRDRKEIIGVTMPGFGTTDRTYNNAINLMKALHITILEIPIRDAVKQHFKDINHDINIHNLTYENSQARERTQILMDLAGKHGGIVIGTGDLSELALGWATFNGDHMSMYGVNSSIPKSLVKYLVEWVSHNKENDADNEALVNEILTDVLKTPVSPELLPPSENGAISQKTEELIGPYELHDFFLYNMLRYGFYPTKIFTLAKIAFNNTYDDKTIHMWMTMFYRRFFSQQFKRSTLPDGPKVGSICLSPRGDLRMPSDSTSALWLKNIESITIIS